MRNVDIVETYTGDCEQRQHSVGEDHARGHRRSQRRHEPRDWSARSRYAASLPCLLAALLLLVHLSQAQDAYPDTQAMTQISKSYLHVEITGDIVTVQVRDVAIQDLLAEIARQSNLTMVLPAPLSERISLEFDRLPLPKALVRILRKHNFALRSAQSLSGTQTAREVRPGKLWIFPYRSGDHPDPQDPQGFAAADTAAVHALEIKLLDGEVVTRQQAIEDLSALGSAEVIAPLSRALADADARVRVATVSALANVGGDQAAATLVVALNDTDVWVREEAVYALGEIGGDTAVHALAQALHDDEKRVRKAAIATFADIGGDAGAQALAVALHDQDPSLRAEAVAALGEIGGEAAVGLLQQALVDHAAGLREIAAEILAELSHNNQ